MESKIIPNILMTLIVGTALAYAGWAYPPATWTVVQTAGACITVVSFILWTAARFQLGSSFAVRAKAKQLVTRGLYSKIRNPIYVFGSLTIVGFILVVGRPFVLLIFLIVVPLQIRRSRVEARVLEAAFGKEYQNYRARTWF